METKGMKVEELTKTLESVFSCLANNGGRKQYVATIFRHVYDDPDDEDDDNLL